MIIRTSILISHDAVDPSANDTTLDLTALLIEQLHQQFAFNDDETQQLDDGFVITVSLDVANVAQYHVEP